MRIHRSDPYYLLGVRSHSTTGHVTVASRPVPDGIHLFVSHLQPVRLLPRPES